MKYIIRARRKDTCEPWTLWATTEKLDEIDYFTKMVEDAGYLSKVFPGNESMAALWEEFGVRSEMANYLYDRGFRLEKHVIFNFKMFMLDAVDGDEEMQAKLRKIWRDAE